MQPFHASVLYPQSVVVVVGGGLIGYLQPILVGGVVLP